jgi:hypothetical protein
MKSPETYQIKCWSVDQDGPIPKNGFQVGGELSLEPVLDSSWPSHRLRWLNGDREACSIEQVKQSPDSEDLVWVIFGSKRVLCHAQLSFDRDKKLERGKLTARLLGAGSGDGTPAPSWSPSCPLHSFQDAVAPAGVDGR